jgi:hemolysin-activating ACP:hemolysin acyltransferase
MKLPKGTTLTGNGLNLVLHDCNVVPEPMSCAEDTWIYDWITPEGRSHITTDHELADLLHDGAKLGGGFDE